MPTEIRTRWFTLILGPPEKPAELPAPTVSQRVGTDAGWLLERAAVSQRQANQEGMARLLADAPAEQFCTAAPPGWQCGLAPGHPGDHAAWPLEGALAVELTEAPRCLYAWGDVFDVDRPQSHLLHACAVRGPHSHHGCECGSQLAVMSA